MTTNTSSLLMRARQGAAALDFASPVFDFVVRLWVAQAFFKAGLQKIGDIETTLWLFEEEYAVPVLPPELAAYLATAAELVLPALLVLGLGTRAAALGLFILNYVAVIAYPDMGPVGIKDHTLWGVMIAMLIFHGPGKLSLDHWLSRSRS